MAQRRRFVTNKRQLARAPAPDTRSLRRPPAVTERVAPVVYGKPFVVVEDQEKNTLVYKAGAWVPFGLSIAEAKETCQVKELSQRLNGKIRYEIRAPVNG